MCRIIILIASIKKYYKWILIVIKIRKFQTGNATRSYCGSEIGESEIYSPYSFCGSDAACLDVSQSDLTDGCQVN